jgi:hypothetical protein
MIENLDRNIGRLVDALDGIDRFCDTGEELLFDLESDPFEMVNLVHTDIEPRERMKAVLLWLLAETREPCFDAIMNHGVLPDGPVTGVSALSACRRPYGSPVLYRRLIPEA